MEIFSDWFDYCNGIVISLWWFLTTVLKNVFSVFQLEMYKNFSKLTIHMAFVSPPYPLWIQVHSSQKASVGNLKTFMFLIKLLVYKMYFLQLEGLIFRSQLNFNHRHNDTKT